VSDWKSLGDELEKLVMESGWFDDVDKAIFMAAKNRKPGEPRPIDWAHDGSEIHADGSTGYRCYICRDARFVRREVPLHHPDFGKHFPCRCQTEDPEFAAARVRRLLDRSQLPAPLREATLASFNRIGGTLEAHDVAVGFIATMKRLQSPRWLTYFGGPGSGKTHLLAGLTIAICVEVGVQPLYLDVRNFLKACRANNFEADDKWTNAAQDVPVLLFDEFLTQGDSDWEHQKLESVLMERWVRELPTVIACSRSEEQLRTWSPSVYSRLSDISLSRKITLESEDYRQRHADDHPFRAGDA
jgi:DNA replication protein DnaC